MQIKGAEASAKPGAMAHQNAWQRWSHGQFDDRFGSFASVERCPWHVCFTPDSGRNAAMPLTDAMCHVWMAPSGKSSLHVAGLVGAAMCSACLRGSHDRWP